MTEKDVTAACLFAMGSGRSSGLYLRSHQEGAVEDKERTGHPGEPEGGRKLNSIAIVACLWCEKIKLVL